MDIRRRNFVKTAVLAGGAACLDPVRLARAMGAADIPQGFREIVGNVQLNGRPAQVGDLVRPGDVVETGPDAKATFVAGKDAYLLRAETRLEIPTEEGADGDFLRRLQIGAGALMGVFDAGTLASVFSGKERHVETPTAVAGIRGTGLYMEVDPSRSYFCTCYGTVEFEARRSPGEKRTARTRHHERPYYILAESEGGEWFLDAPMKNHGDAELRMLEGLVGRKPSFDERSMDDDNRGY